MRRRKALWGGRALTVLVALFVGYLVAGWNPSASHNNQLSAAQMVALRFPQDAQDTQDTQNIDNSPANQVVTPVAAAPSPMAEAQAALLNPVPMLPPPSGAPIHTASATPPASIADVPVVQQPMQVATAEQTASVPVAAPAAVPVRVPPASVAPRPAPPQASLPKKLAAAIAPAIARRPVNERPGFVLNDAQIASIKQRLHLTADQEEMWPAVEAALRNLAYTRAREAKRRGEPAGAQQLASTDPNSSEVQGLKSAAIPLIMSFDSDQKDEVRNLAHVMGLDQLASQF